MKKVDVTQTIISFSAVFGIALLWFDLNLKVYYTVHDLLRATLCDDHAEEEEEEEEED